MVSGEHNLASPSPSPSRSTSTSTSTKQPVSESKTHIISPSRIRHNFRWKAGRNRRKSSGLSLPIQIPIPIPIPIPSLKLRAYDVNEHNSPYYKGLTDQSLAIVDDNNGMQGPHTHTTDHDHDLLSSGSASPYYKGLTDFSLVIGSWTAHTAIPPNNPLSYQSSPYYRGLLTDYSLLLTSSSLPKIKTTHFTLNDLIVDADHVDFLLAQQTQVGNALQEFEEEVFDQEKPLRESHVLEMEEELKHYEKVSEQTAASDPELQRKESRNVYEYTWATKYQPVTLEEFICNKDKALQLKAMVKEGCGCSHFIFEGPPSVGKRSMIRAMLREVFGADRVQVIEEYKNFKLKGEMVDNLQVRVKKSLHHVEVNLSETKGYEKHVIVDLFKETYGQLINNSQPCCPDNCKAIILYEAEKLSIESLLYIKWLLEKYNGCNKVFFCCSDESKLQPVKPLCITVQLSSPSTQELVKILEYIGKEEGIKLPRDLVEKIILRSKNNQRQAIRSLEATCRNKDALKDDDFILTGWEEDILDIADKITEDQSPRQLYVIRRKLQILMTHDVPPHFIYKSLVAELMNLVDESLRAGVAKLDKDFNRPGETMKLFGHAQNKQTESDEKNNDSTRKNALTYLKVEEFIAKFMSWYKNSSQKGNKHVQHIAGA